MICGVTFTHQRLLVMCCCTHLSKQQLCRNLVCKPLKLIILKLIKKIRRFLEAASSFAEVFSELWVVFRALWKCQRNEGWWFATSILCRVLYKFVRKLPCGHILVSGGCFSQRYSVGSLEFITLTEYYPTHNDRTFLTIQNKYWSFGFTALCTDELHRLPALNPLLSLFQRNCRKRCHQRSSNQRKT